MKRVTFKVDERNTLAVTIWGEKAEFSLIRIPHKTANTRTRSEFTLEGPELAGLCDLLMETQDA
jgi:hypothetical protein